MLNYLEKLCLIDGISGRENKVREYIISELGNNCDYSVDALGNLIVLKKGKKRAKNKVMISAHMDEVGFIVTYICDNGFVKFTNVGGIDSRIAAGRTVVIGDKKVKGVIGIQSHSFSSDNKVPHLNDMYIDIGATNGAEVEKYVSVGDSVTFNSDFNFFGENRVKAKAIDDRFGCSVMLKMINTEIEYDTYFVFLVQEEVGCRGGGAAVFTVRPDYAIVLEATTASDISGVDKSNQVCALGEGAVISFMDRSTVYNPEMYKTALILAEKNKIKAQPKTTVAGGNDAGVIHKSCGGVRTIAVSLPCRYIHSATNVACIDDMDSCYKMATVLAEVYANA